MKKLPLFLRIALQTAANNSKIVNMYWRLLPLGRS